MKLSISYRNVEQHKPAEKEVERYAGKLNRLLKSYEPDLVLLHGVFSKNSRREENSFSLNLSLPTGTLHATGTGDNVRANPDINISVAMAVKDGVVGAVIPKADAAKLADISVLRRELTERARAGKLRPADITGGTFTLSNLGMYKIDAFTAIITPPQAAILAVGAIADTVVAVDGKPGIRPVMTMTLSSDHRVIDGARAAEFLVELANAVRNPEKYL